MRDLKNKRFGKLLVLEYSHCVRTPGKGREHIWLCKCDCGNISYPSSGNLQRGRTYGCGCNAIIHNKTNTKEYRAWESMKRRCIYPTHSNYKNYGGRGITVCGKWLNSFVDFLSDIGYAPSNKHTLDRIDNDGNYEPGNVRWATKSEQRRNQRSRK